MLHRKWRETKQQLILLPDLALLGCCLVSLLFLCDILSTGPLQFYLAEEIFRACAMPEEGGPTRMLAPISILDLSFPFLMSAAAQAPSSSSSSHFVKSGPTGSDPEVELISVDCYTLAQGIMHLSRTHDTQYQILHKVVDPFAVAQATCNVFLNPSSNK